MEHIYSPSHRYVVELHTFEMRMSHWVSVPCVRDLATGEVILDLGHTCWHAAQVQWREKNDLVLLTLRRYPGDRPSVELTVDLDQCHCTLKSASKSMQMSIAEAVEWLEMYL